MPTRRSSRRSAPNRPRCRRWRRPARRRASRRTRRGCRRSGRGPAVEPLLRGRDLLGLEDVELHDVLGGAQLAHAEVAARLVRVAEVVGEGELVQQRPEVGALEHLEVRLRELDLGEVGDVVRLELLDERRVVALDFARDHDQRRPLLGGVRVLDRPVDRPVGGLVRPLRGARTGVRIGAAFRAPGGLGLRGARGREAAQDQSRKTGA